MFEAVGNMHMHTPYSDGALWHAEIAAEAIRAGLDFVVVTDHNVWVDGVEGYYEHDGGRVLLLVGEEVHDTRRQPQSSHFLAYGAERELASFAADPQRLIDETAAAGGHGFLAHPFDPTADGFGEPSLAWEQWGVTRFTGLELWNFMSNFKHFLTGKLAAARAALNPAKYVTGPEPETLAKWDELLARGRKVAVIGNSDAHGLTYGMGPLTRVVFPYEFLFRAVNTHVLLPEELNGDLQHDKRLILSAIGRGNAWVAYDLPAATKGFRFSGQSRTRGVMGDTIRLDAGATLQVLAPERCRLRLIHCGEVIAECEDDVSLTHIPTEPGAYRAECAIDYLGQERSWIFSNPIYLQ